MANSNWYYLCDLENKVAIELTQIPEVWGNVTGMLDLSDDALSSLAWAGQADRGFLTETAARSAGILQAGMNTVKTVAAEVAKIRARETRDLLLAHWDITVMPDRWETYSAGKKQIIGSYRQALRDLPAADDAFAIVWPPIPDELSFLR